MASLFRRFKKKLPIVPTTKGSAYYNRENIILNSSDLIRILNGLPDMKGLKTQRELTFNNMPLMEITIEALRKSFGNPSYVLDRKDTLPGHRVLFYKDNVAHYKFLSQYHFFDKQFFFASNKISSMGILSEKDKMKIINRITKKYLDREAEEKDNVVMKLTDPNGSIIYTIDDVYFYMHYIPANKTREKLLKRFSSQPTEEEKPGNFKESLEKYI